MADPEDNRTFVLDYDHIDGIWKDEKTPSTNESDPDTGKRYIYRASGLWLYDWDTESRSALELSCKEITVKSI